MRPYLSVLILLAGACSSTGDGGTQPGPTPAISIGLSATSGSIPQGGSTTVDITITRSGGFTGTVAVTVTGAPAGVTGTVGASLTSGGVTTASVTINAAASTVPGTYTLTVQGSGTGVASASTTYALTVTATTSAGVVLDFSNCTLLGFPVWLAYQDGSGSWTRVTPTANVYRFNLTQSKAAVAWTTGAGVSLWFMTRAELTSGGVVQACEPVGPKRVTGTVAGVGAGHHTWVNLGNSSATNPVTTAFAIDRVRNGPQDLVAYRASQATLRVGERAVITRDLDIPNNGSAGVVDFNGADSFDPVTATVTVSGLAGDDQLTSGMNYLTTASCGFGVLHGRQNLTSPFTTAGIPPTRQRPTDFHVLGVAANSPTLGTRGLQHSFNLLGNRTVTLPPAMPVPTVTVLAGPYRRLQATITTSAEYDSHTQFVYWQGVGSLPMSMLATAGWIGGTAVTLAFPDLSGVAGWNAVWAPPPSATGSWNMMTVGKTMGFAGNLCVEGGVTKSAMRNGTH